MKPLLYLIVTVCMLALGCSSGSKASKTPSAEGISGTDEQIFIGDTIEKNYDPNVIMKRAESFFDKEDYPEAVIEYQHFLELHRVHVLAPYAQYKLGESYFKQVRTIDRDPDPIYKALESFEKLRKDYPASRWDGEAQQRITTCHEYIAQTYLIVGQFYYRREAYLAAAHRFEALIAKYPQLHVSGDALYYLARTYQALGAESWARDTLLALVERFPNSSHAGAGQKMLARLQAEHPTLMVARSTGSPQSPQNGSGLTPTTARAPLSTLTPIATLTPSSTSRPNQGMLCRIGIWC